MAKSWSSRAWTNALLWGRDFKYTSPSINSCKILQIPWTSRPTAHWNQAIRPHPSTHFSTPCVPTISNNFQPQPGYAGLLPLNSCGIWGVRYSWRCGVVFGSPSKAPSQSIPLWRTPGFMMWDPQDSRYSNSVEQAWLQNWRCHRGTWSNCWVAQRTGVCVQHSLRIRLPIALARIHVEDPILLVPIR